MYLQPPDSGLVSGFELLETFGLVGGAEGFEDGLDLALHGGTRSARAKPEWEDAAVRVS